MHKPSSFLKLIYFVYLCLALLTFSCQKQKKSKISDEISAIDSIQIWLNQSKLSELPLEKKSNVLKNAVRATHSLSNDSLKDKYFTKLSFRYFQSKDSLGFRNINRTAIQFNKSKGDSANLGELYWDLAAFFKRYNIQDSAYFQFREAQQVFEEIKITQNYSMNPKGH